MKVPVLVGTHPDRGMWLDDCMKSIRRTAGRGRKIVIHTEGGYEPAALRTGVEHFDRFVFLQDSVTILHNDFWTAVDEVEGGAWLAGFPPMYLGVHEADQIRPLLPDHPVSKQEAINLELHWPSQVFYSTLWPDVTDANHLRMEHRHGRENLILGNHLFEKAKGDWGQN